AQPAPPPAPRTFIVFFDFARAEVTIEAAATIRQAADAAKAGNTARIEVTGHTDRAGSDRLNQELSRRRADAVKAQLQSQGIAADRIATSAKGEGENLVPTADNVREPQNRRVEIILR
ncbi:MAG: OmpA family protein, partial [Alphaproteobacteria bacterium]|nr:OmpA family protein [Alphaproteobacteria bacterium]